MERRDLDHLAFTERLVSDWHQSGVVDDHIADALRSDLERRVASIVRPEPAVPLIDAARAVGVFLRTIGEQIEPASPMEPDVELTPEVESEASPSSAPPEIDVDAPSEDAVEALMGRVRIGDLGKLTSEAVLWFLGVILVLAGSLYFTRSNWSEWTPTIRTMVVGIGLSAYQFLFIALAKLVDLRSEHDLPARILAGIAFGLVPITGFAVSGLHGSPLAWAVMTGLLLIVTAVVTALGSRRFDAHLRTPLAVANGAAFVSMSLSSAAGTSIIALAATVFVPIAIVAWATVNLAQRASAVARPARVFAMVDVAYLSGSLMFASILHSGALAVGVPLALVAVTLAAIERVARPKNSVLTVLICAVAPLSVVFSMSANIVQIDVRVMVLATAALSTYALAAQTRRTRRRLPLALALTTGLAVYFFIPAPFDAVIQVVLSASKEALGYGKAPLPVAYYGLTFLPYLFLTLGLIRKLESWKERRLAQAAEIWLLATSIGLIALAFTSTTDPRPQLFSLPVYGLAYLYASRRHNRAFLAHLGLFVLALFSALTAEQFLAVSVIAAWALGLSVFSLCASALERIVRGEQASAAPSHAAVTALLGAFLALLVGRTQAADHWSAITIALSALSLLRVADATKDRLLAGAGLVLVAVAPTPLILDLEVAFWLYTTLAVMFSTLGSYFAAQNGIGPAPLSRVRAIGGPFVPTSRLGESVLATPMSHLAPIAALVAMVCGLGTPGLEPLAYLAPTCVFAAASWSTGLTAWSIAAVSSFALALGGAALAHFGVSPAIGVFAAHLVAVLVTRSADLLELETPRRSKYLAPLQGAQLLTFVAFVVVSAEVELDFQTFVHLFAIAALGAFAASGVRLLFVLSLLAAPIALMMDAVDLIDVSGSAPNWRVVLTTALGCGYAMLLAARALLDVRTQKALGGGAGWLDAVFRRLPSPGAAFGVAVFTALFVGVGAFPLFFDDESWRWASLAIPILAYGIARVACQWSARAPKSRAEIFAAVLVPVIGAYIFTTAFGEGAIPLGIAVFALLLLIRGIGRGRFVVSLGVAIAAQLVALILTEGQLTDISAVLALSFATAIVAYRERPTSFGLVASTLIGSAALISIGLTLGDTGVLPGGVDGQLPVVGLFLLAFAEGLRQISRIARLDPVLTASWFGPVSPNLSCDEALATRIERALARPADLLHHGLVFFAFALALADGIFLKLSVGLSHWILYGLFFALLAQTVVDAKRTGWTLYAVMAEVILACMWVKLRMKVPFLAAIENIDGLAMIAATFFVSGVYAIARSTEGAEPFARSAKWTALVLPLLAMLTIGSTSWSNVALAMFASAAYAFAGRLGVSRWTGPLAALAFNVGALSSWDRLGVVDPQLFVLPISASVLLLAQLYRRDLSQRALANIRTIALAAVYLSGFVSIVSFDSPSHSLVMAGLCVSGVVIGTLLRIRSYLFLGAGFLVVNLVTNIARFGLSGQTAATIVLTGLGLAILAAMVTFSLNRRQIVARYERWTGELATWSS